MRNSRTAKIVGTGMFVPERIVPNQFFNDLYKKEMDQFLREKRNIKTRHWMREDERTSDLIIPAAEDALKNAKINAEDLDLIIVATDTPDYLSPSTASVVCHRLKAVNAGAYDINSACAGFVIACDIASKYIIADGNYKNILVVGAYAMSKYINFDNYKTSSIFADGASAVVFQPSDDNGILTSIMYSDAQYHDAMGLYAGGTAYPLTEKNLEQKRHLLEFAKYIPAETNGREWPRLTKKVLDRLGKSPEDVTMFFMTQFNVQNIYETLDALKLPLDKAHYIMDRFGYTGSASIGMAIADAVHQKKLKKGDLIVLIGSGGGLSMSVLAMTWGYDT